MGTDLARTTNAVSDELDEQIADQEMHRGESHVGFTIYIGGGLSVICTRSADVLVMVLRDDNEGDVTSDSLQVRTLEALNETELEELLKLMVVRLVANIVDDRMHHRETPASLVRAVNWLREHPTNGRPPL